MILTGARGLAAVICLVLPVGCVSVPFDPPGPDGGEGSVAVEPDRVLPSADVRFSLEYTVGPSGLFPGGGFEVRFPRDPIHPFHGFTPPHTRSHVITGYVSCEARPSGSEPVAGVAEAEPGGFARCTLDSGHLVEGDTLVMGYWSLAPRVAGAYRLPVRARLTGGRGGGPIETAPGITVEPGPTRSLRAILPSAAGTGEPIDLSLVALDQFGNRATGYRGEVRVRFAGQEIEAGFEEAHAGALRLGPLVARGVGFHWATVEETDEDPRHRIMTRSNPVRVGSEAGAGIVLWGDPHAHLGPAEACGAAPVHAPEPPHQGREAVIAAYRHAAEAARLDFVALAEPISAERPLAAAVTAPEGLVVLGGYEAETRLVLTSQPDRGPRGGAPPRRLSTAAGLAEAIEGAGIVDPLVILLGGGIPGPESSGFEIYSSLNLGTDYEERPFLFEPTPTWVVLGDGAKAEQRRALAVVSGSANGWGRPGTIDMTGLEPGSGGLTAVVATEKSGVAIIRALRAGRGWATTGQRIYLDVAPLDGGRLHIAAAGTDRLERVDLIAIDRRGVATIPVAGTPAEFLETVTGIAWPRGGPALWFVRVIQKGGGMAWSTPRWVAPDVDAEHRP